MTKLILSTQGIFNVGFCFALSFKNSPLLVILLWIAVWERDQPVEPYSQTPALIQLGQKNHVFALSFSWGIKPEGHEVTIFIICEVIVHFIQLSDPDGYSFAHEWLLTGVKTFERIQSSREYDDLMRLIAKDLKIPQSRNL